MCTNEMQQYKNSPKKIKIFYKSNLEKGKKHSRKKTNISHIVNVLPYLYRYSENEEELGAFLIFSSFAVVSNRASRKLSVLTRSGKSSSES